MAQYRKKPLVIDAWCWHGGPAPPSLTPEWFKSAVEKGTISFGYEDSDKQYHLIIKTLEGNMNVSPGDWIIKGISNELYPCKPDIFEATYEKVS